MGGGGGEEEIKHHAWPCIMWTLLGPFHSRASQEGLCMVCVCVCVWVCVYGQKGRWREENCNVIVMQASSCGNFTVGKIREGEHFLPPPLLLLLLLLLAPTVYIPFPICSENQKMNDQNLKFCCGFWSTSRHAISRFFERLNLILFAKAN